ncbi:hypothetical protein ZIOFF_055880 [Zingiber officinale]|uniref:Isochorismatase-like domain-containing protein n=1 Tax=Zingiber officinale TaxID=94328 RepID=A0A8J5KQ85_ZINOF|nr:hypothetical protein ZIOFF_055880 [Zingiber officinale]
MLVIDMQKDFILAERGSPLPVAGGQGIVPTVIQAVAAARERGILVIWVVREHDRFGRDVEHFRRHFYSNGEGPAVKGCVGAELADGLVIADGDYKLVKTRFSAFFATNLHLLQGCGIKNLVVVGVQTPNCIRQTVFDAVALDYHSVTDIRCYRRCYSSNSLRKYLRYEKYRSSCTNVARMDAALMLHQVFRRACCLSIIISSVVHHLNSSWLRTASKLACMVPVLHWRLAWLLELVEE